MSSGALCELLVQAHKDVSECFQRFFTAGSRVKGPDGFDRKALLNAAGVRFIRCLRREVVIQNKSTMHVFSVICQAT